MTASTQLESEARTARPAAIAAFASALLMIAPFAYAAATIRGDASTTIERLAVIDREAGNLIVAAGLQALALLLLIGPLLYLFRAIRSRRPEVPAAAVGLIIAGPLLAAAVGVLVQLDRIDVAHDFVAMGAGGTDAEADRFVREGVTSGLEEARFGANLAFGLAIVLVGLYSIRTGLLSRFMGILSIIIGVLYLLPLLGGGGGFIQIFWLVALGMLILDRWPGGRGPAWKSGEAIPWPRAAEQREEVARRREEREAAPDPHGATNGSEASDAGATAPGKRKRKRRR